MSTPQDESQNNEVSRKSSTPKSPIVYRSGSLSRGRSSSSGTRSLETGINVLSPQTYRSVANPSVDQVEDYIRRRMSFTTSESSVNRMNSFMGGLTVTGAPGGITNISRGSSASIGDIDTPRKSTGRRFSVANIGDKRLQNRSESLSLRMDKIQDDTIRRMISMKPDRFSSKELAPIITEEGDETVAQTVPADADFKIALGMKERGFDRRDIFVLSVIGIGLLGLLILISLWSPRRPAADEYEVKFKKFNDELTSRLYFTSNAPNSSGLVFPIEHESTRVIDIKFIIGETNANYYTNVVIPRRQLKPRSRSPDYFLNRQLSGGGGSLPKIVKVQSGTFTITTRMVSSGSVLWQKTGSIYENSDVEFIDTVDLTDLSNVKGEVEVVLNIDSISTNEVNSGVFLQVVEMTSIGNYRVGIAAIIFICTFIMIITEKLHRVYATFIGSIVAIFFYAIIYEVPETPFILSFIEFNTLMLLFSMMVNVGLLATTGIFQWTAAKVVIIAKGDMVKLFYMLCFTTGFLSMFLDNVTTVMLVGPVTISICKEVGRNPVPFYLSETLVATIGGTATLIGDPPNIIIGSKLGLSFVDFIVYNGPLVIIIVPLATVILHWRFKSHVSGKVVIDEKKVRLANQIHSKYVLFKLLLVFVWIICTLFLSPVHEFEISWFMLAGMFLMCMIYSLDDFHHVIEAVEWDTLIFFAILFVFVETLARLGLIQYIGDQISTLILNAEPGNSRLTLGIMLILWVSAIGSAFLESLPYTTTMSFVLINLGNNEDLGLNINVLAFALSVGACVGGIGSIMGSSANLVCMAISQRYSDEDQGEKEPLLKDDKDNTFPTSHIDENFYKEKAKEHVGKSDTVDADDVELHCIYGSEGSSPHSGVQNEKKSIFDLSDLRVITGRHFLFYGFPLLVVLVAVASAYQLIVFVAMGAEP